MTIQRLDLADAETAEELWAMQHAAYRQEAALIGVPDLPPLRDTVESLRTCGEVFYGYRGDDGVLAGAVSLEEEPGGRFAICRMMVDPERQRQGIGSRLLEHVLAELPVGREIEVTAEARNRPAIRLYERLGFEAEDTFHPDPRVSMIRFVRTVPGSP